MRGKVVVPRVEEGMVNHRVLVMEYVEGIKITDRWDAARFQHHRQVRRSMWKAPKLQRAGMQYVAGVRLTVSCRFL